MLLSGAAGAVFGYSIAVSNDAIGFITAEFGLSSLQAAVVVSALVAGALVGCLIAGPTADALGRRRALLLAGVLVAAGCAVTALAPGVEMLVGGRLLSGIAVGVTSAVAPLFLAELAPPAMRGGLITGYQLCITIGILLAFAVGLALTPGGQWRWMIAAGAVPALLQVCAAVLVPPSPHFLAARGRTAQARAVLLRIRPPQEVDAELAALTEQTEQTALTEMTGPTGRTADGGPGDATRYRDVFRFRYRRAVVVGFMAALMNALVGVGAVIYYSTDVFRAAGLDGPAAAQVASLAVGGVNTAAAVVSIGLIGRFGRRPLLSIGLLGIIGSLLVAGIALMVPASRGAGLVTVAAILVYMAFFAISAGPIAWLLVSEVFPPAIRAKAAALATAANWAANMLITLLFPVFVSSPGIPGRVGIVFVVFAAFSAGFLLFVRLRVPETKDRSLREIQAVLDPRSDLTGSGDRPILNP